MQWLRWYHGTAGDPKLVVAAETAGVTLRDVLAVWAVMLEHASQARPRGSVEGFVISIAAAQLRWEPGPVAAIVDEFHRLGLHDGRRILAWERRQTRHHGGHDRPGASTARMRRWRERQRAPLQPGSDPGSAPPGDGFGDGAGDGAGDGHVTVGDGSVTAVTSSRIVTPPKESIESTMSDGYVTARNGLRTDSESDKIECVSPTESVAPRASPKSAGSTHATAPPGLLLPLPPGWVPSPDDLAWSKTARPDLSDADVARETWAFGLHCLEKQITTAHPSGTWRRWISRARPGSTQAARRGDPKPPPDPANSWEIRVASYARDRKAGKAPAETMWFKMFRHHWGNPPDLPPRDAAERPCEAPRDVLERHGFTPGPAVAPKLNGHGHGHGHGHG